MGETDFKVICEKPSMKIAYVTLFYLQLSDEYLVQLVEF